MATSQHLGIRDAVAALFTAGTALAGGRVYENRELPLANEVASQIQVFRVQSEPERTLVGEAAPIDWTTEVRVVIKARRAGDTSAELVADDIACGCYARVMADQQLGGLADEVEPGAFVWDQDEADSTVVAVTWDIRVRHRTESNVIT